MKIMNYNVNGIRAASKKGLFDFIKAEDPDIVCLEEVKCFKGVCSLSELSSDYHVYWNAAERPGYSGTAVFSKIKAKREIYELGVDELDHEGRLIALEFDDFFLVCVYTPNAGDGLKRLDFRLKWDEAFRNFIHELDQTKSVIVTGDLNVAHNEIDLKNPSNNHHNPGFTDEERNSFSSTLALGFKDTFRTLYPEKVEYSWYSYRFHAKEKGVGWRIDYFVVSERFMDRIEDSYILQDPSMSDHQPILLKIND